MNTERAESLVYLLKIGGLWINFTNHQFGSLIAVFQIFRLIYLVVGWFLMINVIFLKGVKFLLTPSAVFIPLGFNVVGTSVLYFCKIRMMEKLILQCDKNLSSYNEHWEKKLIQTDTEKVKYIANCFSYGLTCFGIVYTIMHVIVNIVRSITGNPERYTVPLPFDGYLDDTKERNFNFYIYTLLSDLWLAFGVPNTVAFQCTIFYVVSCTTTEINIIKEYLRILQIGQNNNATILPDWNLNQIILKHGQILRFNDLQNQSIALPTLVQCRIIFTLSICFVMFLILQLFGKNTFVMLLAAVFILILFALGLVLCSAGEYLEEKSDELFYAVCSLPWYKQSLTLQKSYFLLLLQTSKTLVFDYAFTSSLNLRCYMALVNNAFSYLMIMKSLSPADE
ncbi:Odorant receptor 74 [Halyomorpha halys]|nr:Odorant receptor 74 [Halyomorpha halys]